jgi:hypothetical protein
MYTGAHINFGDLTPYLTYAHGQNPVTRKNLNVSSRKSFRNFFGRQKTKRKTPVESRFYLFLFVVREPISGIGEVGEFYVGLVTLQRNICQLFNP